MKITLDHNCIIDLHRATAIGDKIKEIVANPRYQCFVVNIGASEMLPLGVSPETYSAFDELLASVGIADLPRLNPMCVWDMTFWDHCIWADDKMSANSNAIEQILFPSNAGASATDPNTGDNLSAKRLNRLCDVHTMWCHIHYGNDVFCTSDRNFHKASKCSKLIALGAKAVKVPADL
jgi:hypothetical protein